MLVVPVVEIVRVLLSSASCFWSYFICALSDAIYDYLDAQFWHLETD